MIAINQVDHLSDQDLRAVVLGKIPSGRFEQLMEHLDQCQSCQRRASQSASSDSFAEALAAGNRASDDAVLAEADCQAALFHAAGTGLGTGAMRLDAVLPPVEMLGAYRLLRPLGRGGMGAVYLAEHERLKKRCAIKLLPRQHGFDDAWIQRFEREMQAVASLSHAGIVAATDAGNIGGWHYLVMEYLDGLDLAAISRRLGPLDVPVAAAIMRDVCDALAAVHEAGLVHRDIKPSNIMLTRGGATKLLDLGLVLDQKQSLTDMRLTTVGHVIGTLAFAAPEQLSDGNAVDGRADLYSVGATLFQLTAGQSAHRADHGIAPLVIDKTTKPARRLSDLVTNVPEAMDSLVASLLQRDPALRPASAAEVVEKLEKMATPSWNRSAAAKSLVSRAMRISDTEPPLHSSMVTLNPVVPPQPPRRAWLKWLAAGGLPAALIAFAATIVIIIQQGKSQVRIETSDHAIAIRVEETSEKQTIPQVEPAIGSTEKVFKGKTLGYWTNLLIVERDSRTLIDAITAVANLTDKGDVDAAHTLLVASARNVLDGKGNEWEPYLHSISELFDKVMPDPGIDAIAKELASGNEKCRALCLIIIQRYATPRGSIESPLQKWATLPENRTSAERLHDAIRKLLEAGSLDDSRYKNNARQTSLMLALTLDRPLQQEPELRETITAAITKAKTEKTGKEQLELIASQNWAPGQAVAFSGGPSGGMMDGAGMPGGGDGMGAGMMGSGMSTALMTKLTPAETLAAHRLGVALPAQLLTSSILTNDFLFSDQLQSILLKELKSSPTQYADEITFNMWTSMSPTQWMIPAGQQMTEASAQFWIESLPLVQSHTTQPQLLFDALTNFNLPPTDMDGMMGMDGSGGAGMGGMMAGGMGGYGGGPQIPKPLVDVIIQTKASAAKRILPQE